MMRSASVLQLSARQQIFSNSLKSTGYNVFTHTKGKMQSYHPRFADLVGCRLKGVSCAFTHLSLREERASAAVRLRPSSDVILAWTGNPLVGSRQQECTIRTSSYLHNTGFRDDNFILEARKGGEEQQGSLGSLCKTKRQ